MKTKEISEKYLFDADTRGLHTDLRGFYRREYPRPSALDPRESAFKILLEAFPKGIIFTFLFILIFPLYSLAQSDDITVTVTIRNLVAALVVAPTDKTADPGETVTYNFTVQNVSNVADSYNLAARSSERWRPVITSGNTVGPLAPEEIAEVIVEQTVPAGARAGTQDTLTLRVASQTDRSLLGSDSVLTTVNQIAEVALSVLPENSRVRPGDIAPLRARVRNRGNADDSFQLTAVSVLGWVVEFPRGDITGPINPGEREIIPIQVIVPAGAIRGQRDSVTITATSQFDSSVSDSAVSNLLVR